MIKSNNSMKTFQKNPKVKDIHNKHILTYTFTQDKGRGTEWVESFLFLFFYCEKKSI